LLHKPLTPEGGSIPLPTGPGLGIDINLAAMEPFRSRA
jgi:L-alanine-DL-glutamate epimerase-like enolase superfamily enzyme